MLALPGVALTALGGWLVVRGALVGLLPLALGLALSGGAASLYAPLSLVLTPEGIERRVGVRVRRLSWDQLEGLAIERWVAGDQAITRYVAKVRDGEPLVLTSAWENAEAVAASLQARRFAPGAVLDVERAEDEGAPRGDPAEALGIDAPKLARFVSTVERVMRELDLEPARVDRARLQARVGDERYELFSLGRRCAEEEPERWEDLVRAHFERARALRDEAARVLAATSLDDALRARLRPQLVPRRDAKKSSVRRDALPGLREVLALRLQHGDAIVPRARAEAWGVGADELFAIARANLAAEPPPEPSAEGSVHVYLGDERTAARVLDLPALVDVDPWLGALVAVPAQSALLVTPVRDAGDVFLLIDQRLAVLTRAIHAREPRPLSPEIFWWRPDAIVPVPQVPNLHGGTTFVVPDELSGRLVGRIPRPGA